MNENQLAKLDPYINKINHVDCIELACLLPDKSIDIIITDPPFMLKKHWKGNRIYRTKNHLSKIAETFGHDFNPIEFLEAYKEKTKNGFVCWMSQLQLPIYLQWANENKYKWEIMVWCKSNGMPNGYQHLRSDVVFCIRMYKRGAYFNNKLTNADYSKFFVSGTTFYKGHPCVMPLSIMERQIQLFTEPNDIVLDPFSGSGTTLVAAHKLGRNYMGCENLQEYYEIGIERLAKAMEQTDIFDAQNDSKVDEI
jgi:site-specific DNA-methyltransferase (adenine-specific)